MYYIRYSSPLLSVALLSTFSVPMVDHGLTVNHGLETYDPPFDFWSEGQ